MISWALIIETALKWAIPAILVAIVSLITVKIINPLKRGTSLDQQEQWDRYMQNSSLPQKMCEDNYVKLKTESDKSDKEILSRIDKLTECVETSNKNADIYHKKVDTSMENLRLGVLDAHLQSLISTCQVYIKRGYITPIELDHYKERLNIYHQLGGNGHMDVWDEKIKQLPSEPQPSKSYVTTNIQPPIIHK